jgi:GT2 family glycosyltransferase
MTDVSILIVHYKTLKLTTDCIASIEAHTQGISYEIIVIDNDSQDGAKNLIMAQFPAVRWIDMGYNSGFARANNAGIRASKGRFVVLLNSDTYFLDDILTIAVRHLETEPDVAACGGIQLYQNGEPRPFFKSLAAFRRVQHVYPPSKLIDKLLTKIYPETPYNDPEEVDWIPAAMLMARQETIAKAGLLDEQFFMYGEDTDWNCRLSQVGRLKVYNDCRYVHYEWGSKPERKEVQITPINRIFPQITLSNLVWIRKQYGFLPFLLLMCNYWLMVPIYYFWKMTVNIKNKKSPMAELDNQRDYAKKIEILSKYFWKITRQTPHFYKLNDKK